MCHTEPIAICIRIQNTMTVTNRRRGRHIFYLLKPLMEAVHQILRLFPARLLELCATLFRYVPTKIGIGMRYVLARRLAKRCGDNIALFEGTHVLHWENIELGDHVSIHPMCYIDGAGGLRIGSNVSIAHGTSIITFDHDYENPKLFIRDAPSKLLPVTIGDDVWIGAGVRILGGCSIGNHVVVGAGAVITKDIPSNSLAAGVPARIVRSI